MNPENIKKRKHIRSNSCDVKIGLGRSNSREYDPDYRARRNIFHNRSHSRDLDGENSRNKRQPTHSRTNSRDNIKYILNYLKPDANTNKLLLSSAAMMAQAAVAEHGAARAVRKHCRNYSYDQNVMNNIKIDQELHNKLFKHRNKPPAVPPQPSTATTSVTVPAIDSDALKTNATSNNISKEYLDNRLLSKTDQSMQSTSSHSRTNSKDLNKSSVLSSLADDAAASNLRHRRNNSKDLNRILNLLPSTSNDPHPISNNLQQQQQQQLIQHPTHSVQHHKRNVSLTKNEFPEENLADVAQVLLLGNNESSDMSETDRKITE